MNTYECKYRELGMHLTAVFTREEYVVNERIVDHSSLGVVFTFSVEADDTGTTLTASWNASKLMKMLDAVFSTGTGAGSAGWPPSRARSRPWPETSIQTELLLGSRPTVDPWSHRDVRRHGDAIRSNRRTSKRASRPQL
ncbi:MAG: hypothetical protein ACXWXV_09085 [Aeromicrobium sp.]